MTGQAGNTGQGRGGGGEGEPRDGAAAKPPGGSSAKPAGGAPARPAGGAPAKTASGSSRPPGGSSRPPGSDLADDIQRWLVRSGIRSMRRELTDQVRRAFTTHRPAEPDDVWGAATTEPPPELMASAEAPECAWCPICRAARRIRESGPGLGGQLAGAGDTVAAAVQEAMSAFDAVMSRARAEEADGFPADKFPPGRFPPDRFPAAGTPPPGAEHEPDDRD